MMSIKLTVYLKLKPNSTAKTTAAQRQSSRYYVCII